jgi:hypothetical protein
MSIALLFGRAVENDSSAMAACAGLRTTFRRRTLVWELAASLDSPLS